MNVRHLTIMGETWSLAVCAPGEDPLLKNCGGYTDWTTRKIAVEEPQRDEDSVSDLDACRKKIIRHEIIHAFLYESGLAEESSGTGGAWALNEEMVDWFARKGPQIYQVWKEADAL